MNVSLRTRFIALFTLLAVIPLVGVGIFAYVQSLRAVETLVSTQVGEISRNAARQVEDRYALHRSNLLLLGQNAETQRLFQAHDGGAPIPMREALATAGPYLDSFWEALGGSYQWIEIRHRSGEVLYRLGEDPGADSSGEVIPHGVGGLRLEEPITDSETGAEIGVVVAALVPGAIVPYPALETRFGSSGYSVMVDRGAGRVLYHPSHAQSQKGLSELAGPGGWGIDPSVLDEPEGTFTYREADTLRVASFRSLGSPAWTVMASASIDEFGDPFLRARGWNLSLTLLLALAVAGAYTLLTRRATRSLVALTRAADRVGTGDLDPELPEPGGDEVGRLTRAFRVMVDRVRESMRQMEASRQMAAVGQFASQISHEIRNPLTSMNLNLQGLRRDVEAGRIPQESARPVELCLKEVQRLDRVVGGVLSLARPPSGERRRCSIHEVLRHVLDVVDEQLSRRKMEVRMDLRAADDIVLGDPEALESLFLNLCLNAIEAMSDGGQLQVASEALAGSESRASMIRVRVADTGPGIPSHLREEIFQPFFSTKKDGTGLGLSLAARIAENHNGALTLVESGTGGGAEFALELPLAKDEDRR